MKGNVRQTSNESALLRIGDAAKFLDISTRTLRYYEELGLIHPTKVDSNPERYYSKSEIERLQRIKELQDLLGFRLNEIRSFINIEDNLEILRNRYLTTESKEKQLNIIEDAIEINTEILNMIATKLSKVERFQSEISLKVKKLKTLRAQLLKRQ